MNRLLLLPLSLALLAACRDDPTAAAPRPDFDAREAEDGFSDDRGEGGPLRVMTRNLYVGADVDIVLGAVDPAQVPLLVAQAFQDMVETDFPTRARLLAREVARTRPHLIGLQEVSLIRTQSPGDFVVGNPAPAGDVFLDFLEVLLDELRAHHLDYREVARVQNTDVELPMATGPATLDDVRLTDFDVILARADVEVDDAEGRNFFARLTLPPFGIEVLRGFVAVDARVAGRTIRFVNTHLESVAEAIRFAQAEELIAALEGEARPIVLLGDINSDAHTAGPTYARLVGAGYVDAWAERPGRPDPGFTCCHLPDLSNPVSLFDERIDVVFTRNVPTGRRGRGRVVTHATVVGNSRAEHRRGLWASDHGGVVAWLRLPAPLLSSR